MQTENIFMIFFFRFRFSMFFMIDQTNFFFLKKVKQIFFYKKRMGAEQLPAPKYLLILHP